MRTIPKSLHPRYHALLEGGRVAMERGAWQEAADCATEAMTLADRHGDQAAHDRFLCGWSSAAINLGELDGLVPRLREVLVRSADADTRFLAGQRIADVYEHQKAYKKGLFYARLAHDQARRLADREWLAYSHNQLGNFLIAESRIEAAAAEYERARKLAPDKATVWYAVIERNLGYCRVLQGRYRQGLELLYTAWRAFRRQNIPSYVAAVRVDLSFAHLELARPADALRHARAALKVSDQEGDVELSKNALYLLGEAAVMADQPEVAQESYRRLQQHYPDLPFVADFLANINVRTMINLRA